MIQNGANVNHRFNNKTAFESAYGRFNSSRMSEKALEIEKYAKIVLAFVQNQNFQSDNPQITKIIGDAYEALDPKGKDLILEGDVNKYSAVLLKYLIEENFTLPKIDLPPVTTENIENEKTEENTELPKLSRGQKDLKEAMHNLCKPFKIPSLEVILLLLKVASKKLKAVKFLNAIIIEKDAVKIKRSHDQYREKKEDLPPYEDSIEQRELLFAEYRRAYMEFLLIRGDQEKVDINGAVSGIRPHTLLYAACSSGISDRNLDIVQVLIDHGADVNKGLFSRGGRTPLHISCLRNSEKIVELLLDDNERPIKTNIDEIAYGATPLYFACENNCKKIVKLLLDKGADMHKKHTDNGKTPHDVALGKGNNEIVKLLVDKQREVGKIDLPFILYGICQKIQVVQAEIGKLDSVESIKDNQDKDQLIQLLDKYRATSELLTYKVFDNQNKGLDEKLNNLSDELKPLHFALINEILTKDADKKTMEIWHENDSFEKINKIYAEPNSDNIKDGLANIFKTTIASKFLNSTSFILEKLIEIENDNAHKDPAPESLDTLDLKNEGVQYFHDLVQNYEDGDDEDKKKIKKCIESLITLNEILVDNDVLDVDCGLAEDIACDVKTDEKSIELLCDIIAREDGLSYLIWRMICSSLEQNYTNKAMSIIKYCEDNKVERDLFAGGGSEGELNNQLSGFIKSGNAELLEPILDKIDFKKFLDEECPSDTDQKNQPWFRLKKGEASNITGLTLLAEGFGYEGEEPMCTDIAKIIIDKVGNNAKYTKENIKFISGQEQLIKVFSQKVGLNEDNMEFFKGDLDEPKCLNYRFHMRNMIVGFIKKDEKLSNDSRDNLITLATYVDTDPLVKKILEVVTNKYPPQQGNTLSKDLESMELAGNLPAPTMPSTSPSRSNENEERSLASLEGGALVKKGSSLEKKPDTQR